MATQKPTPRVPAKPATQVEAEGEDSTEITLMGDRYTIPATPDDLDLETMEAFEDGKAVASLRGVLGEAQYRRLIARHSPKARDLADLMDPIAAAYGFDGAPE